MPDQVKFVTMQAFEPVQDKVEELHRWAFNGTSEKLHSIDKGMKALLPLGEIAADLQEHIWEARIRRKWRATFFYVVTSIVSIIGTILAHKAELF